MLLGFLSHVCGLLYLQRLYRQAHKHKEDLVSKTGGPMELFLSTSIGWRIQHGRNNVIVRQSSTKWKINAGNNFLVYIVTSSVTGFFWEEIVCNCIGRGGERLRRISFLNVAVAYSMYSVAHTLGFLSFVLLIFFSSKIGTGSVDGNWQLDKWGYPVEV